MRTTERRLGVDDPFEAAGFGEQAGEGIGLCQVGEIAEEGQSPAIKGRSQFLQEQPAKQARQHAHGQEEPRPAGDPARAVGRDATARHDAMEVGMIVKVLAPAVQHRDEADLGAEMLGIGGDRAQRLGRRPEQDGVDHRLVLEGDRGDLGRQREHHVEIGNRQKLGLARGEPVLAGLTLALRAMPVAAGIVGHADRPAGSAALDMAAECGGPAQLDRAHHAPLDASEMAVMGRRYASPWRRKISATSSLADIGGTDQPGGTTSMFSRSSGLRRAPDQAVRDPGVARRARQIVVAEQHLDDADVGAVLQKMGGEAVPQRVDRHALVDAGGGTRRAAGRIQHLHVDVAGLRPVRGTASPCGFASRQ